jgi:hypothetical protein
MTDPVTVSPYVQGILDEFGLRVEVESGPVGLGLDPVLTRLEQWSRGHKSRSVCIESPDSYGAGCWTVTLGHEKGVTHAAEANFWTLPDDQGGEPAYVAQALAQGVVFAECPEDRDWAGLLATLTTALDAFDRGVMGPRGSQFSLPAAVPSSREADMLRAALDRMTADRQRIADELVHVQHYVTRDEELEQSVDGLREAAAEVDRLILGRIAITALDAEQVAALDRLRARAAQPAFSGET